MSEFFGGVLLLAICVASIFFYFLPAVIASSRKSENATAIALVTLFFGWTGLVWFACLIWGIVDPVKSQS